MIGSLMCGYEKGSWYFYCFYGFYCRYSMRAEFMNGIFEFDYNIFIRFDSGPRT